MVVADRLKGSKRRGSQMQIFIARLVVVSK